MEVLQQTIDPGLSVLRRIFADASLDPNSNHELLAAALRSGCRVFTTNFDTMIEVAYEHKYGVPLNTAATNEEFAAIHEKWQSSGLPAGPILFKLHGCIQNMASIRATLSGLREASAIRGPEAAVGPYLLPSEKRNVIKKCLKGSLLIVLGYSGGDDFDVMPSVENVLMELSRGIDPGGSEWNLPDRGLTDTRRNTFCPSVMWIQHRKGENRIWNGVSSSYEGPLLNLDRWICSGYIPEKGAWGAEADTQEVLRTIGKRYFNFLPDNARLAKTANGTMHHHKASKVLAAFRKLPLLFSKNEQKNQRLCGIIEEWIAQLNPDEGAKLHFVGELLLQAGYHADAYSVLQEALQKVGGIERKKTRLGLLSAASGLPVKDHGESIIEAIIKDASEDRDFETAAFACWLVGILKRESDNLVMAHQYCDKGLAFAAEGGPSSKWIAARLYNLRGMLYKASRNYKKAEVFVKKAMELNRALKKEADFAVNQANLGGIYLQEG
jgi:tetratricopeptide (TPR) repeat protein